MAKHTILVVDSNFLIAPSQMTMVKVRAQLSLNPYRLALPPEVAPFFELHDVRAGMRSANPRAQILPGWHFAAPGRLFDAGPLFAAMDFVMTVCNTSNEPRPFVAYWDAQIIPHDIDRVGLFQIYEGASPSETPLEHFGSKLDRVQDKTTKPEIVKRDQLPSFGWDPFGDD